MLADAIRRQYEYNRWATEQVLNAADHLTRDEFVAPDDSSFGSIRNSLVHLIDVQRGWISICDGSSGDSVGWEDLEFEEFPDVDSVRSLWLVVEKQTDAFLLTLAEEDLSDVVPAKFEWGDMSAPLWEMLVHVVYHCSQHRSEAAVTLSRLGHSPGMVDFILFSVLDRSTMQRPDPAQAASMERDERA